MRWTSSATDIVYGTIYPGLLDLDLTDTKLEPRRRGKNGLYRQAVVEISLPVLKPSCQSTPPMLIHARKESRKLFIRRSPVDTRWALGTCSSFVLQTKYLHLVPLLPGLEFPFGVQYTGY